MNKMKKLLSVLLAVVLALSCMSVMASAAGKTNYKTVEELKALGAYSPYGQVTRLSLEERTSIVFDFLDNTLAPMSSLNMGRLLNLDLLITKLTLDVNLTSVDGICDTFDSIESLWTNGLFSIAKAILNLGDLEKLSVSKWDKTGMSRDGTDQFTILSEIIEVLSDQGNLIDAVLSDGLDLGMIASFLGSLDLSSINTMITDLPGLVKGLVFPLIERWDDDLTLIKEYDTNSKGNGNVNYTVNKRVKKLFTDDMSIQTIKYDENGKMTSEHTRWVSFATGSAAPSAPTANSPRCYYQFSSTTPGSVMTVWHIVDAKEAEALAKTPDEVNGSMAAYNYFKEKQTFVMAEEVEGSGTYVWKAYERDEDGNVKTDENEKPIVLSTLKWYADDSQLLPGFNANNIDLTTMSAGELLYTFIPVLFNDMAPVVLNGSVKKILAEFFGAKFTRVGTVVEDSSAWVLDEAAAAAIPDADETADIFTTEQGDYMFEWSDYAVVNGNHYYRYLDDIYVGDISAKNNYFDIINWDYEITGDFMNQFVPTSDDDASKRLLLNLNDFLVKVATTITKASAETVDNISGFEATWTCPSFAAGNANLVANIKAAAQAVIGLAPQHIFGSDYKTNERCYYDLLMSTDNDTVLTGLAAQLVDIIMPSMSLPGKSDILASGAKVGAVLAAVIREFAAYLAPEYNFDALIYTDFGATDGVKNFVTGKDSEYWFDVCMTMGINVGFEYLRAFADMGEGTTEWNAFVAASGYKVDGGTYTEADLKLDDATANHWEAMLDYIVDWALEKDYEWTWKIENLVEVDGLTIDLSTVQNPFNKIDKILFGLIPFDEILSIDTKVNGVDYRSGTRFEKFLRYDLILGIVDLRWDALVGTIAFPATDANYFRDGGVLTNLASLLKRIVNGIFDKLGGGSSFALIPSAISDFDTLANQANLVAMVKQLVGVLYKALVTNKGCATIFPFLNFLLGWKTDPQKIADPQIWTSFRDNKQYAYQWNPNTSKDTQVNEAMNATEIKVLNNSAGMLETHRNSNVTDNPYDIKINSVTSDATVNAISFTYSDGNGIVSPYETLTINVGGTYKGDEAITVTIAYDYVGKDGKAIGSTQYTSISMFICNKNVDTEVVGRWDGQDDEGYTGTDPWKKYVFTEDIYDTVVNYTAKIFYVAPTIGSKPTQNLGTIAAPDWTEDCNVKTYYDMQGNAATYFDYRAADADAGWASSLSENESTQGYLYKAASGVTAEDFSEENSKNNNLYGLYDMGRIAVAYGSKNKNFDPLFIYYNDYGVAEIYAENKNNGYNANQGVSADLYNDYNAAWKDIVKYATYPLKTEAYSGAETDYVKTIMPKIPAAIEAFEAAKEAYETALADAQASGAGAALPAYIQALQAEIDNDFMNGKEINFQDYEFYEYFNYNDVKVAAENLYRSYLQPEVMDTYYILNSGIREAELKEVVDDEANATIKEAINASRQVNNADAIAASKAAHDEWKMPVTTKLIADDFTSRLAYYKQFLNADNREDDDHLKFLEKEIAFVEAQGLSADDYESVTWGRYAKALAEAKAVAAGTDEFASFNSRIYDVKYNLMVAYKQLLPNWDEETQTGSLIQSGGTADLLKNIEKAEAILAMNLDEIELSDKGLALKDDDVAKMGEFARTAKQKALGHLIEALGYNYQAVYSKHDPEVNLPETHKDHKNIGDLKYNKDGSPMMFNLYADSAYEYAENDRPYKTGNQAKVDACNANLEACLAYFVTEVEVTFDGINGGVADTVLDGEGNPVLDENGFQTGYVYGIDSDSTTADVLAKLESNGYVEVTGTGTGAAINVYTEKDGEQVGAYTLVVFGDVNGDGTITNDDFVRVKQKAGGADLSTAAQEFAADVNGDNNVTNDDFVRVKQGAGGIKLTNNPRA